MTTNFPNQGQLAAAIATLPSFECPTPDRALFGAKFDGSIALPSALNFANDQLCSGLYLAGLILSQSNAPGNFACDGADLSAFEIEGTDVRLVIGNLTVTGDLVVNTPLIVTGNLIVEGLYRDIGPESPAAILGNLICHNVRTTSWVIVGGETRVEHFFYGHYNDDAFECIGSLSAKAVLTEEHQILAGSIVTEFSPVEASFFDEHIFDTRQSTDIRHLLNLWDDNLAAVIELVDLRTCLEEE